MFDEFLRGWTERCPNGEWSRKTICFFHELARARVEQVAENQNAGGGRRRRRYQVQHCKVANDEELELTENSDVCIQCVGGDPFVKKLVEIDGHNAQCSSCGSNVRVIGVSSVAVMVRKFFEEFVKPTDSSPWAGARRAPSEIVQDILGCDRDELARAIVDHLHDEEQYTVVKDGETALFDETSDNYEILVPHSDDHDKEWDRFVEGVKHRGRFYLRQEQDFLEKIFRPVLNGDLHRGTAPIVKLGGADDQIRAIYRGRVANSHHDQKRILENTSRELAPPPPTERTGGRMNAMGTVAFYGATDVKTCVAELVVPFGGGAIVGKFEFQRQVRVLDLRLLSRASIGASRFDPEYGDKVNYLRFMRRLRNILRTPVLPGSETLDYLPTQMVAEYLAQQGLDGVMFVSAVVPEAKDEADYESSYDEDNGEADIERTTGVNVVLFSHAAVVASDVAGPRRRILKVNDPVDFGPGREGWFYVEVADGKPPVAEALPYPMFDDATEPTLRLLEDETVLARPRKIEYDVAEFRPQYDLEKDY